MPSLQEFRIAGVNVSPNLILAPMSGVTNSCFRRLIKEINPGAVGLVVTEFISIEGMTRKNEQSLRMMRYRESERPVSIQIFGYDIERMVEAAKMVEQAGADIVDINSGCPVPKVVKRGGGCELMRQPEHLGKLLAAVRAAVSIPLTLKIRAGWDNNNRNAVQIARIAEDAGVQMLAVHGRSRQDMYRGEADWQVVKAVTEAVRIPVVGSGDVVSAESAGRSLGVGVSGLMIGRAVLTNPWIFSEVRSGLENTPYMAPPPVATAEVLSLFRDMLLDEMPAKAALGRLKQLCSQVTRRVRGAAEVRRNLCCSSDLDQFSAVLERFREDLLSGAFLLTEDLRGDRTEAGEPEDGLSGEDYVSRDRSSSDRLESGELSGMTAS